LCPSSFIISLSPALINANSSVVASSLAYCKTSSAKSSIDWGGVIFDVVFFIF